MTNEIKNTPPEVRAFKSMTLSQCGQFDKQNNAKNRLTGWGIICKDRQARGVSRAQRVRANKLKASK